MDVARGDALVDRVAPFRLPKLAALNSMRQHLARRYWAPESFRELAARGGVHPTMRGVLVPFYAYRARCRSSYSASVGVDWYRTVESTGKDGKRGPKRVRQTEWFPLQGSTVAHLHAHLESASRGLPSSEVSGLGRFDLGRAVQFNPHLLAGWDAELPSRTRAQVDRDAEANIQALQARHVAREILPGDRARKVHTQTEVELLGVELVLLPVWITTYEHAGAVFRVLVHGQNGACFGQAPVSRAKVATAAVVVAVLGVAALYLWGVLR